jgi:hypothetical protein
MLPDEVADGLDRHGQPRRTEMIVEKVEAAFDLADYLERFPAKWTPVRRRKRDQI